MAEMKEILVANLTLDTIRRNNIPPLIVPQGDYGARVVHVRITIRGNPVFADINAVATITAKRKKDGEAKTFPGNVNDDGTVNVPITQWMLEIPNEDVVCHVSVTGIGYVYSANEFIIIPQERADTTDISEDDPRVDVITEVLISENERRSAEIIRVENENSRIVSEENREISENERNQNEEIRISNENDRVFSESARKEIFDSWSNEIALLPGINSRIDRNSKRITNLERGIVPNPFETDETVSYEKIVPENALPYAEIKKIGGITKKTSNLLNLIDKTHTSAGVTAIVSDQRISFSGIPTNSTWNNISSVVLYPGTYTISCEEPIPSFLRFYFGSVTLSSTVRQATFTITSDSNFVLNAEILSSYSSDTSSLGSFGIMLNVGSTPLPYEPYYEELLSAKVTAVSSLGVNIWDEQWEVIDSSRIGSKNFITVKPNTQYYINVTPSGGVLFYDESMKYVGDQYARSFTTPSNVYYLKFSLSSSYGTVYKNDVCLNVYNENVNGIYYPYTKKTIFIPEFVQSRDGYGYGINESLYNYIDWENRKFVKKVGEIDLGSIDWYYGNNVTSDAGYNNRFKPNAKIIATLSLPFRRAYVDAEGVLSVTYVADSFATASEIKQSLNGVMMQYELIEPEVIDISGIISSDNFIEVDPFGNLTFENELKYDVPSTVVYQLKEVSE